MANTYTSITTHFIFSTKKRQPLITATIRERLWAFMGGIARENGMKAHAIGGIEDHVHLLLSMPPTISPAEAMKQIKGASSKWVNQTFPDSMKFSWQAGYGAFSVGLSEIPKVSTYIRNQREHHRSRSFQEEYMAFLTKHQVRVDVRYLWD